MTAIELYRAEKAKRRKRVAKQIRAAKRVYDREVAAAIPKWRKLQQEHKARNVAGSTP